MVLYVLADAFVIYICLCQLSYFVAELIYDYVSRHDLPLAITGSFFEGVSVNLCVHNAVLATNKVLEGLKR